MAFHALFSARFRPFFLAASIWAAIAVPVWLAAYAHGYALHGAMPAAIWHPHEMVFGFGMAAVAGFLLTAIPNWTGRLPVRGGTLAGLAVLWLAGRIALLVPGAIGTPASVALDLSFAVALIVMVARELVAGGNWRNLPMLAALALLLAANVLVHLHAEAGNRLGIATLSMLIALIVTAVGLGAWVVAPSSAVAPWLELTAGIALAARLARWRGGATLGEPLLFILHVGYGWLAAGLILLGLGLPLNATHALTVGAIGTMTLAVMTRASLGHTGRALTADRATIAIYVLVTLAALARVLSPLAGSRAVLVTSLAGIAWSAAFATFAIHYGGFLLRGTSSPIHR